jgi:hypothetical protein
MLRRLSPRRVLSHVKAIETSLSSPCQAPAADPRPPRSRRARGDPESVLPRDAPRWCTLRPRARRPACMDDAGPGAGAPRATSSTGGQRDPRRLRPPEPRLRSRPGVAGRARHGGARRVCGRARAGHRPRRDDRGPGPGPRVHRPADRFRDARVHPSRKWARSSWPPRTSALRREGPPAERAAVVAYAKNRPPFQVVDDRIDVTGARGSGRAWGRTEEDDLRLLLGCRGGASARRRADRASQDALSGRGPALRDLARYVVTRRW